MDSAYIGCGRISCHKSATSTLEWRVVATLHCVIFESRSISHSLLGLLCPSSGPCCCHLQHQLALDLPVPWALFALHFLNLSLLERYRLALRGHRRGCHCHQQRARRFLMMRTRMTTITSGCWHSRIWRRRNSRLFHAQEQLQVASSKKNLRVFARYAL